MRLFRKFGFYSQKINKWTNRHETSYARTKQIHATSEHGIATSLLPQGTGGKLFGNLFDRPRITRAL